MAAALNLGWWVFTTDYEGLKAEYTTGLQSGHAVLDSTRAVSSEGPSVGLSHSPYYALWGYSGGSLASMWAAELQPSYAPELNFAGIAVGGATPNVSSVLQTINKGPHAGLAFSGLYGQAKAFPNLTDWLNANLIPSKSDDYFSVAHGCLSQANSEGKNQTCTHTSKMGKHHSTKRSPSQSFSGPDSWVFVELPSRLCLSTKQPVTKLALWQTPMTWLPSTASTAPELNTTGTWLEITKPRRLRDRQVQWRGC